MVIREAGFDGQLTATSREGAKTFTPHYLTAAYMYKDANSVDLYLSEFPEEWFRGGRLQGAGSILHVHFFLSPSAGSTPIDVTACNVVFMNLILTGQRAPGELAIPEMGLYAGGGFLLPDDDAGDETFGGGIDRASHRLSRATPGFVDLLGTGYLTGAVSAPLDEKLALLMRSRMDALVNLLPRTSLEAEGLEKAKTDTQMDAPE